MCHIVLMRDDDLKKVIWVGNSHKQLKTFPKEVQKGIGDALLFAQAGYKHPYAKPFKGVGIGVFEIVKPFDTDTYRAVYAVKVGDHIYVLHAFQKKSASGIKTAKQDIDLIKSRFREAKEIENEE